MKKTTTILAIFVLSLMVSIGTVYAGLIDLGTIADGNINYNLHYDDNEGVVYAEYAAPDGCTMESSKESCSGFIRLGSHNK